MKTHVLPQLPYELDALAPAMSRETMEYHYGKHHQAYVNNLNNLLPGSGLEDASLEQIIVGAPQGGLLNNAAQVYNHTMFFLSLSPSAKKEPSGPLAEAIKRDFGSTEALRDQIGKAGAALFGSGWVWLARAKGGKLSLVSSPNAGNPLVQSLTPLLNIDVWEHAYYIDYRNRRPDFLTAIWDIVDWAAVEKRF
ncbi:superoxide dismutase [Fe] [Bacteroidia bacterium]|nr:superoxide dismutase [Fe] [Bacteroidia bacterium]